MRLLIPAVLLLASIPASAGRLGSFQKQFHGTGTADATGAVVEHGGSKGEGAELLAYVLAIPFAYSLDMTPEGYARWPYDDAHCGDIGEKPLSMRFESYYHRVGDGVGGPGGRWRLDSEKHVGLEVFWTHYRERGEEDLNYLSASAHGDVYRDEYLRTGYQLGLAALSGRLTRLGPRVAVEAESYPLKPVFFDARVAGSFIDNGPLGELGAGAGVSWKSMSARFGWRALMGPFRTLDGPDAAFAVRF